MKLSREEKEVALQVNALLMAVHYEDTEGFKTVLDEAGDDAGPVLIGGILILKDLLDNIVRAVEETEVVDLDFDFPALTPASAEFVINSEER